MFIIDFKLYWKTALRLITFDWQREKKIKNAIIFDLASVDSQRALIQTNLSIFLSIVCLSSLKFQWNESVHQLNKQTTTTKQKLYVFRFDSLPIDYGNHWPFEWQKLNGRSVSTLVMLQAPEILYPKSFCFFHSLELRIPSKFSHIVCITSIRSKFKCTWNKHCRAERLKNAIPTGHSWLIRNSNKYIVLLTSERFI